MIELEQLRPLPLESQGLNPASSIFNTMCRLEQGTNYQIHAESGKGKSTLIHIVYGLRKDYDGQVRLDGTDLRNLSIDDWTRLRREVLSVVFQDLRLFLELSAMENILLKAELTGHASSDQVVEMATRLGIRELLDQKAETLSYGQKQRVAIIRALVQPFRYLLLDEPFSHLDPENTRKAITLIQENCQAQNASMLLTSLDDIQAGVIDQVMKL